MEDALGTRINYADDNDEEIHAMGEIGSRNERISKTIAVEEGGFRSTK